MAFYQDMDFPGPIIREDAHLVFQLEGHRGSDLELLVEFPLGPIRPAEKEGLGVREPMFSRAQTDTDADRRRILCPADDLLIAHGKQARPRGRCQPIGLGDGKVVGDPHGGGRITLRDLISHIVRTEVDGFRTRQEEYRVIRTLTARQINDKALKGKVVAGGVDLRQPVDEGKAVATALQAFEDGLYMVIVDDQQERDLDREVYLHPDSRVTFLRLVMLAGG